MNEPLDLKPELAHKKRLEDLELMRKLDEKHKFPISQYEIKDILFELNLRVAQYKSQSSYSFDFKVLQTIQDFMNVIKPLHEFKKKQIMSERLKKAKVGFKLPIAQVNEKMIWVREYGDEVFSFQKPKE